MTGSARLDGWTWQTSSPTTSEVVLGLKAEPLVTGWNRALGRPPEIPVDSVAWTSTVPRVVSMLIDAEAIGTRSFAFAEPAEGPAGSAAGPAASSRLGDAAGPRRCLQATRIRPPDDIIKLEDRLQYLLQPLAGVDARRRSMVLPCPAVSLTSWKASRSSIRGMRRCWPTKWGWARRCRRSPRIRLLLRRGEIRSVLLVCPKPLVTQLAAGVPALGARDAAVGDRGRPGPAALAVATCRTCRVRIANYELLRPRPRDRSSRQRRRPADLRFDLVVLDESQRIKNRASTTSEVVRGDRRGGGVGH